MTSPKTTNAKKVKGERGNTIAKGHVRVNARALTSMCYTSSPLTNTNKKVDSPPMFSGAHWARTKSPEHKGWETVPRSRNVASPRPLPPLGDRGIYVSWKNASIYFVGQDVLQVVDSRGQFVGKFLYASGNRAHYFADGSRASDLIDTLDGARSKWRLAIASDPEPRMTIKKPYLTPTAFAQKCEWLTSFGCGPLDPSKKESLLSVIVAWVMWTCVDAPVCVPVMWFSHERHIPSQVEEFRDRLEKNGVPCAICSEW